MTLKFEDLSTPGYIRIVNAEGTELALSPQEASDLLQWLYERQDVFEEVLHPEPPTQKLTHEA